MTNITIPNSATSIGGYAFYFCKKLDNVTIPTGVTSIEGYTFQDCKSLTNITIPNSVTSIGDSAFWECGALINIIIPEGVAEIGSYAFSSCGLTGINIPKSVTKIGLGAFSDCKNLTSLSVSDGNAVYRSEGNCIIKKVLGASQVILGCSTSIIPADGSVTVIASYAFSGCKNLTDIAIPDSVDYICSGAFKGCSSLTSVTIPVGVTTIDGYAFDDCDRLADVYFGGTQEQWNAITIDSNNEPLTNAAIHFSSTGPTYIAQGTCGDNLTWTLDEDGTLTVSGTGEMPSYSSGSAPWYSNCSSIEAIVIEKGVTSIGDYAFYYCSSLSSVTIPEGITSIGTYAFYECSKLTSVTISDDVTSIGDDAFTYSGLTDVYYDGSLVAFARIIGENWKLAEAKIHHCDGTDQFAGIGICGNDLMWTLDAAGKMTISGTGDMENYSGSYSGQPWRSGLNL